MWFGVGRKIDVDIESTLNLGKVTLPAGELFVSGSNVSFWPKGGQKIFRYKTDGEGNVVGYYINDQEVSLEDWKVEIAKDEGLRNSNFGQESLCGETSLACRKASTPDLID
ncbi:MAG: hypothetical protein LBF49_02945 [Puniceicoccales bacterium]|jgi:hypothetical protein|nr:hypothetical protein [Puniceicoccales bacterium]